MLPLTHLRLNLLDHCIPARSPLALRLPAELDQQPRPPLPLRPLVKLVETHLACTVQVFSDQQVLWGCWLLARYRWTCCLHGEQSRDVNGLIVPWYSELFFFFFIHIVVVVVVSMDELLSPSLIPTYIPPSIPFSNTNVNLHSLLLLYLSSITKDVANVYGIENRSLDDRTFACATIGIYFPVYAICKFGFISMPTVYPRRLLQLP